MSTEVNDFSIQQKKFDDLMSAIAKDDISQTIYTPAFQSVAETIRHPEMRAVIFFREAIHNAIAYRIDDKSLDINIYSHYSKEDDCTRYVIPTNARPFKNIEDVVSGCRPFFSRNTGSSVFGGGLKLSAYANNPNYYELIIASHTEEDGFVSITGTNDKNSLKWELSSVKVHRLLSELMQDSFNDNYVYYLIRHPNCKENYTNDGNMADLTWMIGDIIEDNKIKVHYLNRNIVFGDKPRGNRDRIYENLNDVARENKSDPNRNCYLLSMSEYNENYCHKRFDYEAKEVSHINDQLETESKTEINYDASVSIFAFPGFSPVSSSNAGTFELSTMKGTSWIPGMGHAPDHGIFVRFPCFSKLVYKNGGQDLYSRLKSDALYMGQDSGEYLTQLGFPRITGDTVYDSKDFLEEYSSSLNSNLVITDGTNTINLSNDDTEKRKPFVVIEISITKINFVKVGNKKIDLNKVSPEQMITNFGGVMEGVFYLRNGQRCRKVIKTVINALAPQITKEQEKYFWELAPRSENECIPIEEDSDEGFSRLWAYDIVTDKITNEFETDTEYHIYVRDSIANKIDPKDIEIIDQRGHFIGCITSPNGETHLVLSISPMMNSVDKSNISIEQYQNEVQEHGSNHKFWPKREVKVRRRSEGGKVYSLGKVKGVPKINIYSPGKISPATKSLNKKKNIDYLASMGDSNLFCVFQEEKDPSKNHIVLNKDNRDVNLLFVDAWSFKLKNVDDIKMSYRMINNLAKELFECQYSLNMSVKDENKPFCNKYKGIALNVILDKMFSCLVSDPNSPLRQLKNECEKLIRYKTSKHKEEGEVENTEGDEFISTQSVMSSKKRKLETVK